MRRRSTYVASVIFACAVSAQAQNPNNEQISPTVDISVYGPTITSNGTVQYFSYGNGSCVGYHRIFGTSGGVLKEKSFSGVRQETPYNAQIVADGQPPLCYRVTVYAAGFFGTSQSVTSNEACLPPSPPPPDPPPTPDPLSGSLDAGAYDPIVISLGGSYKLSAPDDPVSFAIDAAGRTVKICWTARDGDDAFLALDRNGNGQIDNGSELFGNSTPLRQGGQARSGFDVLAEYDANGDGVVDSADPVWTELLLWTDLNHNGVSDPSELRHITESSITAIELQRHWTGRRDQSGNWFGYEGHLHEGRRVRSFYDIFFVATR